MVVSKVCRAGAPVKFTELKDFFLMKLLRCYGVGIGDPDAMRPLARSKASLNSAVKGKKILENESLYSGYKRNDFSGPSRSRSWAERFGLAGSNPTHYPRLSGH